MSGINAPTGTAKGRMIMRQFRISVIVDLPDDLFTAAAVISGMQPPFGALLARLTDTGAQYETFTEVTADETPATRKRKAGRPRAKRAAVPFMPATDGVSVIDGEGL